VQKLAPPAKRERQGEKECCMSTEGAFPAPPIRAIHVTPIWRAVQTSYHYLRDGEKGGPYLY